MPGCDLRPGRLFELVLTDQLSGCREPLGITQLPRPAPEAEISKGHFHRLRVVVHYLFRGNTAFITAIKINPAVYTGNPTEPALMAQALADGSLNYGYMKGLFSIVEANGPITKSELQGCPMQASCRRIVTCLANRVPRLLVTFTMP